MTEGLVYAIGYQIEKNRSWYTKVGSTKRSVDERMKEIQPYVPFKLVKIHEVRTIDCRGDEAFVHHMLRNNCKEQGIYKIDDGQHKYEHYGEWYEVEDVKGIEEIHNVMKI